jgi:hypothetical protein
MSLDNQMVVIMGFRREKERSMHVGRREGRMDEKGWLWKSGTGGERGYPYWFKG